MKTKDSNLHENFDMYQKTIDHLGWNKSSDLAGDDVFDIDFEVDGLDMEDLAEFGQIKTGVSDKKDETDNEQLFVLCLDNTGYEDFFEVGVEYLLNGEDGDFLLVENMEATEMRVFKERFELV